MLVLKTSGQGKSSVLTPAQVASDIGLMRARWPCSCCRGSGRQTARAPQLTKFPRLGCCPQCDGSGADIGAFVDQLMRPPDVLTVKDIERARDMATANSVSPEDVLVLDDVEQWRRQQMSRYIP